MTLIHLNSLNPSFQTPLQKEIPSELETGRKNVITLTPSYKERFTKYAIGALALAASAYVLKQIYDQTQDYLFQSNISKLCPELKVPYSPSVLANLTYLNNLDCIKAILEAKANPNVIDTNDLSPLHKVAGQAEIKIIQMLIEAGANLNARDHHGDTPLHQAITWEKVDIAEILINSSADLNARDQFDRTPLHVAIERGRVDITQTLIQAGANLNAKDVRDRTPLHQAVLWSRADIAEILVNAGADLNMRDKHGLTPLETANSLNRKEIAEILGKTKGKRL